MNFYVYGPFEAPRLVRQGGEQMPAKERSQGRKDFWAAVEEADEGLSGAIGVYVYSLRNGESYRPWYVGMTRKPTGFKTELFQPHQIKHYSAVEQEKRGQPVFHLIARVAPERENFTGASDAATRDIKRLESWMIATALAANAQLRNVSETAFEKNLRIWGIKGPKSRGRRSESVESLKAALRL